MILPGPAPGCACPSGFVEQRHRQSPRTLLAGGCLAVALLLGAAPARAVISPASTIDGPSADIVGFGNAAVSEDGSGGVVYLKRVGGRVHVFAAQFVNDAWQPPQQVDVGQRFDSSWPAIGAGDGGRLVVVWAQPYAANIDRVYFSALDPGATSFQSPHVVDPNVGLGKYLYPSISMSRGGLALLTYRVVTNDQPGASLPQGYVQGDIRLARYDGAWWSVSPTPLERNVDQPERTPTAENSPRVGIGLDGNGVVAWQEPDDNFYDRIWARRVFAGSTGNVLEVSPTTLPGSAAPLNGDASALGLHVTAYEAAAVAIAQQPPTNGAGFKHARVFVNQIPDQFDPAAGAFAGARPVDGGAQDGPVGPVGPVSVGSSGDGGFDVSFGSGSASFDTSGDPASAQTPARLDDGTSPIAGNPIVSRADSGAANFAWVVNEGGAGGVGVLERDPNGTPTQNVLSADTGGDIHAVDLAGSDIADAVIGFLQGDGTNQTINVATINAPPGAFDVAAPPTWTDARRVPLEWDPAPHGMTPVTYTLLVDDQDVADGLHGTSYSLWPSQAGDGIHTVSVSATDTQQQETDSSTSELLIDRTAPRISLRRRGRTLRVAVSDGPRGQVSGVAGGSTKVSWGDKRRSSGSRKLTHNYQRDGSFTIKIVALDNAGNRRVVKKRVRL
jgi:hypothetical protein